MSLFGEVWETKYAVSERHDSEVLLREQQTAQLGHAELSPILPEEGLQLHGVVNKSHAWAATVHVYLRAIFTYHVYRPLSEGRYVRESRPFWFDSVDAARSWDRNEFV